MVRRRCKLLFIAASVDLLQLVTAVGVPFATASLVFVAALGSCDASGGRRAEEGGEAADAHDQGNREEA